MSIYSDLRELALRQDDELAASAKEAATAIVESEDSSAAMAEFFAVFRGPYAAYKADKAKTMQSKEGKAFKRSKDAVSFHLRKTHGFASHWADIRTGEGKFELVPVAEQTKRNKEAKAAQEEKDAKAAADFRREQQRQQAEALQAMPLDELAVSLLTTIDASGRGRREVLAAVAKLAGFGIRRMAARETVKAA